MGTKLSSFERRLLDFLKRSTSPFHAVAAMVERLTEQGFEQLREGDSWQLQAEKSYLVTRNDSSIIAFRYQPKQMQSQGIAMVGAHTDSPCLKVKPKPELQSRGYFQLGVEVYGGALLNPWFDRDLSLAGRVVYRDHTGKLISMLMDFERPIATIPSLAIHLNREANSSNIINNQQHLPPILWQISDGRDTDFRSVLKQQFIDQNMRQIDKILDYELLFYDTQAPGLIGLHNEFIASARLDNLLSCFIGLEALLTAPADSPALLICNDHEEVGSTSACGAQGPMLQQCLQRILPDQEQRLRTIDRSLMISADNAHGIHPNYADKHDSQHGPLLNFGPVIKVNANQRYATNSESSSWFKHLCETCGVPLQEFVTRSDLGCGSTIGPITASALGVKTLDIGVPTFAMHSIRELAGRKDATMLWQALTHFYATPVSCR
ncbi:MAG: aspartyl aminopeptidase [Cellvibrionaceae bacterium]|jgi:aspartyl aminopeptidase